LQIAENTLFTGKVAIHLEKTDSTNNYAKRLLSKQKPSEGTAIIADFQEQGKGQPVAPDGMMGNKWESEEGKNLLVTYVFYPKFLEAANQFYLNMAMSLAVMETVHQLCKKEVLVKWPNDIYVEEKKISGILIENTISGNNFSSSLIGIGLNVNQIFPEVDVPANRALKNPVSLKMLTDKNFKLQSVFEKLSANIENRYLQLMKTNFRLIKKDYLDHLYQYKTFAWYRTKQDRFEGAISGIDETGRLMIDTDGETRVVDFKEVGFE